MAMLAEPKRKQKFSINPQGTSWSNDESKFGQKMLERMGWSRGKGLGAKEDGRVEHVKISLKADQKGVGCTKNHADNWIAHQDDFNSLLESLNQDTGGDNSSKGDNPVKEVLSLEKKSQSSTRRLHYGKFTRGKDLSSRSSNDLKCIFGERATKTSAVNTPAESSDSDSNSNSNPLDDSLGFKTIKSTSNLQEYFAQKMAALKGQGQVGLGSKKDNSGEENVEMNNEAMDDVDKDGEDSEEKLTKKKKKSKKKKKKKADLEEDVVCEDDVVVSFVPDDNDVSLECSEKSESKPKKKKKKQKKEVEERDEEVLEVKSVKKDKKRKKDKIEIEEENEEEVPKKKKKKSKSTDNNTEEKGDRTEKEEEGNTVKVKQTRQRGKRGKKQVKPVSTKGANKKTKKDKVHNKKVSNVSKSSKGVDRETRQNSIHKKVVSTKGDNKQGQVHDGALSNLQSSEAKGGSRQTRQRKAHNNIVSDVCNAFRGANVGNIDGYHKASVNEHAMWKKIEEKHQLWTFNARN